MANYGDFEKMYDDMGDGVGFTVLPTGDYNLRLCKIDQDLESKFDNGHPQHMFQYEVIDGEFQGKKFTEFYSLDPNKTITTKSGTKFSQNELTVMRIIAIAKAIGITDLNMPDLNAALGMKPFLAKVEKKAKTWGTKTTNEDGSQLYINGINPWRVKSEIRPMPGAPQVSKKTGGKPQWAGQTTPQAADTTPEHPQGDDSVPF